MCISCSVVSDSVAPRTEACQTPLSMEYSRQEYWSGKPFPSPEALPHLGFEPWSPTLQADSLPSEPPRKPVNSAGIPNLHFCVHLSKSLFSSCKYRKVD